MNFIIKNLKQAGIFNTLLIVIALALQIYVTFTVNALPFDYFFSVLVMVALFCGFFYAFNGYKKDAAKYYKLFMNICLLTYFSSTLSDLFYMDDFRVNWTMVGTYAAFLRVIPIALLAFVKDFGKKKSLICANLVFLFTLFIFVRALIVYSQYFSLIVMDLSQLALSAIVVVFAVAKYKDKEARGTK